MSKGHRESSGTILFSRQPSADVPEVEGEGRICAMQTHFMTGGGATMVGYIYNADGVRVAKGSITSWRCHFSNNNNGFTATNSYVIGPSGEQITETDGSNNWVHTNVNVPGGILATYDPSGRHFQIGDWLGSRRVQTNYAGVPETYSDPQASSVLSSGLQVCSKRVYKLFWVRQPRN